MCWFNFPFSNSPWLIVDENCPNEHQDEGSIVKELEDTEKLKPYATLEE